MSEKLYLTWGQFDEAIKCAASIYGRKMYKQCPGIYGIPRGGLVVAVALSHHIELPLLAKPCRYCIVVDDVVETGKQMRETCGDLEVIRWTWISKNTDIDCYFYIDVPKDQWVVFPWSNKLKADEDALDYYKRR